MRIATAAAGTNNAFIVTYSTWFSAPASSDYNAWGSSNIRPSCRSGGFAFVLRDRDWELRSCGEISPRPTHEVFWGKCDDDDGIGRRFGINGDLSSPTPAPITTSTSPASVVPPIPVPIISSPAATTLLPPARPSRREIALLLLVVHGRIPRRRRRRRRRPRLWV